MDFTAVLENAPEYPLADGFRPRYGTAGFRGPADKMEGVVYRAGLLTALRCLAERSSCGLMITASHNPVDDNGVKIIDFNGEMLTLRWEDYAEKLVDSESPQLLVKRCQEIADIEKIKISSQSLKKPEVFLGHDTRPSSPKLFEIAKKAIQNLGVGIAFEPGLHTTPQVHFRVWRKYRHLAHGDFQWLKYLAGGYMRMARGSKAHHGGLIADCAHGVAAHFLEKLGNCPGAVPQGYRFQLRNTGDGVLNKNCGAEYVQKERKLPDNFEDIADWQRCASIDGDADRVVYFTRVGDRAIIFDGDRIAAAVACYIKELLSANADFSAKYTIGVVLTAYSDSALLKYLKSLRLETKIVPTGVKHLLAAAREFDIGIYYEPNGHGSVVFGKELSIVLRETEDKPNKQESDFELLAILDTLNQATGDAISNILFVEALLRQKQWSLQDWLGLYTASVVGQWSIAVNNKSIFKMNAEETMCIEPKKLQSKIHELAAQYPETRAFVRPSGTEDVVRVFVESSTQENVDSVGRKVIELVRES